MTVPNPARLVPVAAVLALWLLAETTPARADLRVNDLDIYLNDHDVTVHVVLLGTIPPGFHEGLQSGIPAHVRYTVELWQYNRLWRDALIKSVTIERPTTERPGSTISRASGSRYVCRASTVACA